MTQALRAAIGAYYRTAILEANQTSAVARLTGTLLGNPELIAEARSEQGRLEIFAKAMGGIDRLRQRDFVSATTLQGLTEALVQL